MLRRFGNPVLDGRLFDELAEGVVDFNRSQFRSVEVEKFLLRKFLRIERGFPCRIRPSRCANVETRHMSRDYNLRRLPLADFPFVFCFFLGRGRASAWAAMPMFLSSSVSEPAASPANCGSFCFSFSTGSKRSPIFSTRASTSLASKTKRPASFFFSACSTSSQVTGVDTVGCSRARSEYTEIVVLCWSFWLQSTRTLLVRTAFFMSETTNSGCSCSSRRATARANDFVCS